MPALMTLLPDRYNLSIEQVAAGSVHTYSGLSATSGADMTNASLLTIALSMTIVVFG